MLIVEKNKVAGSAPELKTGSPSLCSVNKAGQFLKAAGSKKMAGENQPDWHNKMYF
ncbi:MAG: hypothetical protein BWY80_00728 [Firmicutes bacterium ADurb.Bin456]|nr:MAG: hypothetical protein BWY80_00728 [Firmicutes bacterium ADurb.Bin456]